MTIRRRVLGAILSVLVGLTAASPSFAQDLAAAKAVVDAAKARGAVGEQADGLLGLVSAPADPGVQAAVDAINAGRSNAYGSIAAKTGVTPENAAEAAAQQILGRMPSGYWYKPAGGAWTRK